MPPKPEPDMLSRIHRTAEAGQAIVWNLGMIKGNAHITYRCLSLYLYLVVSFVLALHLYISSSLSLSLSLCLSLSLSLPLQQ